MVLKNFKEALEDIKTKENTTHNAITKKEVIEAVGKSQKGNTSGTNNMKPV